MKGTIQGKNKLANGKKIVDRKYMKGTGINKTTAIKKLTEKIFPELLEFSQSNFVYLG